MLLLALSLTQSAFFFIFFFSSLFLRLFLSHLRYLFFSYSHFHFLSSRSHLSLTPFVLLTFLPSSFLFSAPVIFPSFSHFPVFFSPTLLYSISFPSIPFTVFVCDFIFHSISSFFSSRISSFWTLAPSFPLSLSSFLVHSRLTILRHLTHVISVIQATAVKSHYFPGKW